MRTAEVWPEAFEILGPKRVVAALAGALESAGAANGDADAWTTLRVEAGRPAYGVDMDDGTIPVEAGIQERAIDSAKGCYTGQEVIVRIRDRGHVNRTLRLVRLGDVAPPAPGTELFEAGSGDGEKAAATVTSAVRSPREGETLALAYVRRGVEGTLRAR
jgi:folate-binding protein YgfZ